VASTLEKERPQATVSRTTTGLGGESTRAVLQLEIRSIRPSAALSSGELRMANSEFLLCSVNFRFLRLSGKSPYQVCC